MKAALNIVSDWGLGIVYLGLFWLAGLGLSRVIAMPPALLGLLLLFSVLVLLGRVPKALNRVCQFCLTHLSLFFIAPLLASGFYLNQLHDKLWLFLLGIVVSTVFSLWLTAWLAQKLLSTAKSRHSSGQQHK